MAKLNEVQDLRKCSRKDLTDQQIASRIHLIQDQILETVMELEELKDMLKGLQDEVLRRKLA